MFDLDTTILFVYLFVLGTNSVRIIEGVYRCQDAFAELGLS